MTDAPRTYQGSEIIPDFGYIRVETNCSGVRIQGVPILVDLIIKDTYGAPERRVTSISVNSLLICLVCLRVLLLGHVTPAEKIPALRIGIV